MADTLYPDNLSILDLENTLKCPVCFELRDGYIFMCQRGHHLCAVCSRSLLACPTCQYAITGCRNFVVETLISKYGFLKFEPDQSQDQQPSSSTENSTVDESKETTTTSNAPEEQEENYDDSSSMPDTMKTLIVNNSHLKPLEMSSGTFPCELATCKGNKVNIGVGAMIPHLRKVHGSVMHYLYNTYATVEFTSPQFVYRQKRKYHQAYHISNMGVFFFYISVLNDGHINMWITTAAPSSVACRFQYEICLFITQTGYYCTSFVGQVQPCGTEKTWLLERNEVMVVPRSKHLLERDQTFEMDVSIVYN